VLEAVGGSMPDTTLNPFTGGETDGGQGREFQRCQRGIRMLGRASELVLNSRSMLRDPQHAQDAGGEDVEGAGREGGVLNVCVVLHVLYLSGGGGGVLRGKARSGARFCDG
jgi:hypothetical protein